MIGHEAIGRTEQALAGGGVQHQFAKRGVESLVEPALAAVRDRKRPMHDSVALVVLARKARKIEGAMQVRFDHGDGEIVCGRRQRIQRHRFRSSRREEALNSFPDLRMSLLTSAATSLWSAA